MSVYNTTILLGLFATLIFFIGLIRGAVEAISDADKPFNDDGYVEEGGYAWTALTAVIFSATAVALAGVHPWLIYLGPILAIGTATGIGAAFLVGDKRRKIASSLSTNPIERESNERT